MDKVLYNSLRNESTENLFSFFKHKGSYNFQKKILAGKILCERKYDKQILRTEKEKIVQNLHKDLWLFYSNHDLKQKSKSKNRKKIFFVIIAILGLMSANLIYRFITNGFTQAFGTSYALYCIILVAFIAYNGVVNNKHNNPKGKTKSNSWKEYKIKRDTINKEWKF